MFMLRFTKIILGKIIGGLIKIIITIKATADAIMDRDCNLPAVRGRPRPVDLNTAANCAIDQVIKWAVATLQLLHGQRMAI